MRSGHRFMPLGVSCKPSHRLLRLPRRPSTLTEKVCGYVCPVIQIPFSPPIMSCCGVLKAAGRAQSWQELVVVRYQICTFLMPAPDSVVMGCCWRNWVPRFAWWSVNGWFGFYCRSARAISVALRRYAVRLPRCWLVPLQVRKQPRGM